MKPAPPVTRIRFGEWTEEEDALEALDTVEQSTGTVAPRPGERCAGAGLAAWRRWPRGLAAGVE